MGLQIIERVDLKEPGARKEGMCAMAGGHYHQPLPAHDNKHLLKRVTAQ